MMNNYPFPIPFPPQQSPPNFLKQLQQLNDRINELEKRINQLENQKKENYLKKDDNYYMI